MKSKCETGHYSPPLLPSCGAKNPVWKLPASPLVAGHSWAAHIHSKINHTIINLRIPSECKQTKSSKLLFICRETILNFATTASPNPNNKQFHFGLITQPHCRSQSYVTYFRLGFSHGLWQNSNRFQQGDHDKRHCLLCNTVCSQHLL